MRDKKQKFTLENLNTNFKIPIVAYFRDFSAPVEWETDTTFDEKLLKGGNHFKFTLPNSKKVLEFKLLTHKDEKEIDAEVLAYKKLSQATGVDNTLTTRLKKQIISVDGETEQSKINAFVDNQFLALDTSAFRDYVDSLSPDIEFEYQYTSQIGEPHTVNVPMGVRFFWPESDR